MGRLYQPPEVRLQLRREVNFGCPIPGCGSPYLYYHHFDPPYNEQPHHDPEGMIALCAKHHAWADKLKWTKEQLRQMKRNPYLQSPQVSDQFGWRQAQLIVLAGGFYINPRTFVRIKNRNIIWCNRDDSGLIGLNLDIRDEQEQSIIVMQNNDWLEIAGGYNIEDIEIPPHGHALTVKVPNLGLFLSIEFRWCSAQDLKALGSKLNMRIDERPGVQGPIGPLNQVAPDMLKRMIDNLEPGFERDLLLSEIQMNVLLAQLPTRWEFLTQELTFPITVCTVELHMRHPLHIDIAAETENVGGWQAGHTICSGFDVIWDLYSNYDESGESNIGHSETTVRRVP